jgi:hypothetical protein
MLDTSKSNTLFILLPLADIADEAMSFIVGGSSLGKELHCRAEIIFLKLPAVSGVLTGTVVHEYSSPGSPPNLLAVTCAGEGKKAFLGCEKNLQNTRVLCSL